MLEDMPRPGTTVGPWLILDRLGSGTFGVVFRARRAGHPDAPPVALKLARKPRDPRFEREAELLQHSQHPGIPRFEDRGLWTAPSGERYPYVVMELVEGFPLYDWFLGGRTSREVLHLLAQIAGALAAAHAGGAVHRDVKGDNIRVTSEGRAVLVDWGSGWFAGARPLTDTTAPPGTTAYRPPEQRFFAWRFQKDLEARWQAQPSDDLYALGVTLYRLVTGVYLPPLSEGGEVEHTREVPPPSDYATLSEDLEVLILRLLSNERELRGTTEALAREAATLAEATGEAADRDILPTESAKRTDDASPSSDGKDDEELLSDPGTGGRESSTSNSTPGHRPEPADPAWVPFVLASMAGGLMVSLVLVLALLLTRPGAHEEVGPSWASPPHVAQFAPDAGVGEEVLDSVQDMPSTTAPAMALAKPMPSNAFPGQKKPPCDLEYETVALGACWVRLEKKPPCGSGGYELDGLCVRAVFPSPRQPTSEEP